MDELCKMEKLNFHGLQRVSKFLQPKNRNVSQNASKVTVIAKCVAMWYGIVRRNPPIGVCWGLQRCVSLRASLSCTTRLKIYILLDWNGQCL